MLHIARGNRLQCWRSSCFCLLGLILTFSARPAAPPSHQSSLKKCPKLKMSQQHRVLAKAATCGWRDCLLWRRARASTACAGLPSKLSPPAGSAQPCLLRAQRARRAPPSELLQRVKQKAAAAASPESNTRCCRPARTCTLFTLRVYCTPLFSPAETLHLHIFMHLHPL